MASKYPKMKFHASEPPETVHNEEEEEELGPEWTDSPADHGIETAPGDRPDPAIAAKRKERESKKMGPPAGSPKR